LLTSTIPNRRVGIKYIDGREHFKQLAAMAREVKRTGRRHTARLTTIKGERMAADIRTLDERWLVATYYRLEGGKARTLLVCPTGKVWTLLPEEQRAVSTPNKYTRHLERLIRERWGAVTTECASLTRQKERS
jgi:hypothetical protein